MRARRLPPNGDAWLLQYVPSLACRTSLEIPSQHMTSQRTRRRHKRYYWALVLASLTLLVVLRAVGERHWAVGLASYAPRWLFLLPLIVGSIGMLLVKQWKPVLATALVVIAAFPLMGFVVNFSNQSNNQDDGDLRIYSHNVAGAPDVARLVDEITTWNPHIVLLQEAGPLPAEVWTARLPAWSWHKNGPFLLGSRLSVLAVTEVWSKSHIRYEIEWAGATLTCFNIHPSSIRFALKYALGRHVPFAPNRWQRMSRFGVLEDDMAVRLRTLRAIARAASAVSGPVVVAGDTNLPGGGSFFSEEFAALTDAFEQAGGGWGYTFPARFPWMRLDRVWLGGGLEARKARVGAAASSDHLPVLVEVGTR